MPNTIQLTPQNNKITHDPTKQINGNPQNFLGNNPFGTMTTEIIFGAVNTLLDEIDMVTGLDLADLVAPLEGLLGTSTGLLTGFFGFLTPGGSTVGGGVFGPLLGLIPGLGGGTGTLGGLGGFLNPTSFIGSAAGIFGPLLSGGSLLGGLIPGLDASKIISGAFPLSMVTSLTTLFGGFGTSTSILSQLIALIPGLTGGLTGLGGLGSIFTDLTHILGSPTALGSGTPVLPGVTSIPILGGLLSGGSLLGSLIPGLDASKIVSGIFGLGTIPNLPAAQVTSGTFGAGLIPGLDASKIITGAFSLGQLPSSVLNSVTGVAGSLVNSVLGAGVIPSLPASQITTGTFGAGLIPSLDASKVTTGIFAETVTGVNSLRDAFVQGFLNTATGGWTNADAQNQAATVAGQAAAAAAAAAQANATLAAQAAQNNANNAAGGVYFNILPTGVDGAALSGTDFSSTGPTSGDLCIRGSSGYIGIKASAATNVAGYYAILNHAFGTDDQVVEVTLGDQGSLDTAYTTLYAHCDTSHTVGAYCSIGNGRIVIGSYTRSGGTYTYTPFSGGGNTYTSTVQAGSRVGFRNSGTSWNILINGNPVLTKVDSSVTFSAARRSAAVSMDRQHSAGFFGWGAADYDSFRIASISMADYVVPTYLGSGARINRTATGNVAPTTAAVPNSQLLPTSFFGVTNKNTADVTVDLTNGKFTVANAGWYKCTARIQLSAVMYCNGASVSMSSSLLLYKNGAIAEYGMPCLGIDGSSAPIGGMIALWSSFDIYLAAGDYVQLGYAVEVAPWFSGAGQFTGEATGTKTFFEIALLNRSTM